MIEILLVDNNMYTWKIEYHFYQNIKRKRK